MRVTGFPKGDNQNARKRMQVIKILADAQHAALAMHMPRETSGNRSFGQSMQEDVACALAHACEIRHAEIIKTAKAISCQLSAEPKKYALSYLQRRFS